MARKNKNGATTALAKTDPGGPPPAVAELYRGSAGEGLEQVRPQDVVLPRLVIGQALTPTVQDKTFEVGAAWDSVSGDVILEPGKPRTFSAVYFYLEWIEWADRDSGKGILDRSNDPDGKLAMSAARGDKDKEDRFVATEYLNIIALFEGRPQPVVIGCAKSNHKHGKRLVTMMKMRGADLPIYAGRYTVATVPETNKRGQTYWAYKFENAGWNENEVVIGVLKEMCGRFTTQHDKLRTSFSEEERDGEASASETDAEGNKRF